ncbi:MFS transporter [Sphingosinicella sp. CPCC 101087]|uniref:MFS transporter n=1 Tax=Sphingosinicella sp. CPCC 101087 TaxID=2497754 RepID=UPI00101D6F7E|nr:MFS transporter [Sphingosinicella sp. CPCC 101087]
MTEAARAAALGRALWLLAIGGAVIVATEFIVVGLLPILSRDLGLELAETAHLVGAFALSAAVAGPLCMLALAGQPPRRLLAGTLLLFAAGNIASILVPDFMVLIAIRIVQGAALPVFLGAGARVVTALAPPGRSGRALALANLGFAIGLVLAMPAGVALVGSGAWAPAFAVLALLALATAGLVVVGFPAVGRSSAPSIREQLGLLARPLFVSHLLLSVAVFAAMFAAYTYIAALLGALAGLEGLSLALALTAFGGVGLIGNAYVARIADRAPLGATVACLALLAASVLAATRSGAGPGVVLALLVPWGAAHTAGVALCQVRVTLAGGRAPAFAMAMNIASANLGIALGALAGGMVVHRWGLGSTGWATAGLALVAGGLALVTARLAGARRDAPAQAARCAQIGA